MEEYDCNVVANNNVDFIVADNLVNGKIPILLSGANGAEPTYMNFNVSDLIDGNASFRTRLKKTIQNIDNLKKDKNFISNSFNYIQDFINEKLPQCPSNMEHERSACIFDNEPFKYMVENNLSMCTERAAMSQYICQQVGIKSHYVNSQADIKNQRGLHAYVIFENEGANFIYDPNNPGKNGKARILDTDMDNLTYNDFLEAVDCNADSNNRKEKKRVGFKAKDISSDSVFIYHSNCGIQGETVTPSKLKQKRMESSQNKNGSSKEI